MATLQVRDIEDKLYSFLKTTAKLHNRSISQQVLFILENYLNSPGHISKNSTLEFLNLSGAWKDEREAEEIIKDLRKSRNQSKRFGEKDGLFD